MKNYNNRKCIVKILSFILALMIVILGCQYAVVRNASKGVNKVITVPTGNQVIVSDGEVRQVLEATHDFNGVSLRMDHNLMADLGIVTVQLKDISSDKIVMFQRVPVWMIDGDEDVFFASSEKIVVSEPRQYEVIISYRGPVSGMVTAQTGMSQDDVCAESSLAGAVSVNGEENAGIVLAMGMVSDYCRKPLDAILTIAAALLMSTGVLLFGELAIRRKKNQKREALLFLTAYIVSVTSLFILSLSYAETDSYNSAALGISAEYTAELRDDSTVDAGVTLPTNDICGIELGEVTLPDQILTDEKLIYRILEAGSNHVFQTGEIALSDLLEKRLYIALDDRYNAGTKLVIHLQTSGLVDGSVELPVCSQGGTEGNLYISGEKYDLYLCGTMYQVVHGMNYSREVMFYVAALLIGGIMAYLLLVRKIPLFCIVEATKKEEKIIEIDNVGKVPDNDSKNKKSILRSFSNRRTDTLGLLGLLLFSVIVADYGYGTSIDSAKDMVSGEIVSIAANDMEEWQHLTGTESIVQTFTAGEDELCGIALELSNGDFSSEGLEGLEDIVIHAAVRDAAGNVVCDADYRVGDLRKMGDAIGREQNDSNITLLELQYRYLPFAQDVRKSKGQKYTLMLSSSSEEADLLWIGSSGESEGNAVNLILMYHSYNLLPAIYWTTMIGFTLLLCLLYVWTGKRTASPIRIYVFWAIVTGVFISFLIPPYCVPDENTHINMVYWISNQFSGVYQSAGPQRILQRISDYAEKSGCNGTVSMKRYLWILQGLGRKASDSGYIAAEFTDIIGNASIWTFLPSVIGFQLARMLGYNFITMVMAGSWANLLVVILFTALGIRKCPVGKRALIVVGLFPMLLQMIASCSYDAMIIAFAMLFIGYAMHLILDQNCCGIDYLVCMLSGFLLVLNKKGVYLPLLCILILAPVFRRNRKKVLAVIIPATIVCVIAAIVVVCKNPNIAIAGVAEDNYSIAYFLQHPMMLVHVLENTTLMEGDRLLLAAVANGMAVMEIYVPTYVVLMCYVLLWRSAQVQEKGTMLLGKRSAYYVIMCLVLGVLAIYSAFLMTMSGIGGLTIQGIQGRYFLPLYALLAVVLPSFAAKKEIKKPNRLIFYMGMVHLFVIMLIFKGAFQYVYWG